MHLDSIIIVKQHLIQLILLLIGRRNCWFNGAKVEEPHLLGFLFFLATSGQRNKLLAQHLLVISPLGVYMLSVLASSCVFMHPEDKRTKRSLVFSGSRYTQHQAFVSTNNGSLICIFLVLLLILWLIKKKTGWVQGLPLQKSFRLLLKNEQIFGHLGEGQHAVTRA